MKKINILYKVLLLICVLGLMLINCSDSEKPENTTTSQNIDNKLGSFLSHSQRISNILIEKKINNVGFIEYTSFKNIGSAGKYVYAELRNNLVNINKRINVVEREKLDSVLSELKLSTSDLVDSKTTQKLGNLVGVQAFVTGEIIRLSGMIKIYSRIIDIGSAKIIGADTVCIPIDNDLIAILGDEKTFNPYENNYNQFYINVSNNQNHTLSEAAYYLANKNNSISYNSFTYKLHTIMTGYHQDLPTLLYSLQMIMFAAIDSLLEDRTNPFTNVSIQNKINSYDINNSIKSDAYSSGIDINNVEVDFSKIKIDVLVNGQSRGIVNMDNKKYVLANDKEVYQLRIYNGTPYTVGAAISIDGLDSFKHDIVKPSAAKKRIIRPYKTSTIKGWQTDSSKAKEFVFCQVNDSVAYKKGVETGNMQYFKNIGLITISFFLSNDDSINITKLKQIKAKHVLKRTHLINFERLVYEGKILDSNPDMKTCINILNDYVCSCTYNGIEPFNLDYIVGESSYYTQQANISSDIYYSLLNRKYPYISATEVSSYPAEGKDLMKEESYSGGAKYDGNAKAPRSAPPASESAPTSREWRDDVGEYEVKPEAKKKKEDKATVGTKMGAEVYSYLKKVSIGLQKEPISIIQLNYRDSEFFR